MKKRVIDGLVILPGSRVARWIKKNQKRIEGRIKEPLIKRPLKKKKVSEPTTTSTPKSPTKRDLIVRFAHWGIVHNDQIHYNEIRPIPKVKFGLYPKLPLTTDCSGFATMCYQYAGAPDPNGQKYDGEGYTGTLLSHGKKISKPQPGDIVVYGGGTGHHAAVVIAVNGASNSKIITASHGNENGPYEISVADEAKYQPAGITFLSYLP